MIENEKPKTVWETATEEQREEARKLFEKPGFIYPAKRRKQPLTNSENERPTIPRGQIKVGGPKEAKEFMEAMRIRRQKHSERRRKEEATD